jgi:hypothetical protein
VTDLLPEGVAHAGAVDPHPAVPATSSRGEKVETPDSLECCTQRVRKPRYFAKGVSSTLR